MIKKGLDLFTTTGQIAENYKKYAKCSTCTLCMSPYFCLCMSVCKYRSATFGDYIEDVLGWRLV
jgi:hypothetical protein